MYLRYAIMITTHGRSLHSNKDLDRLK